MPNREFYKLLEFQSNSIVNSGRKYNTGENQETLLSFLSPFLPKILIDNIFHEKLQERGKSVQEIAIDKCLCMSRGTMTEGDLSMVQVEQAKCCGGKTNNQLKLIAKS